MSELSATSYQGKCVAEKMPLSEKIFERDQADTTKCDETRPHCRACVRTKRTCPGYPDPFDLVHRDHTSSFKVATGPSPTSEKSKSSTSDAETPSPTESKAPDSDASTSNQLNSKALSSVKSASPVTWPPALGPADLYHPMEDTVVPLWFNAYLYLPQDPSVRSGFMEVLPGMYDNAERGSQLHLSTLAVGFFTLAAWTGQASLLRASERYFMRALPKIREALQLGGGPDINTTLISILLLSIYEVISTDYFA